MKKQNLNTKQTFWQWLKKTASTNHIEFRWKLKWRRVLRTKLLSTNSPSLILVQWRIWAENKCKFVFSYTILNTQLFFVGLPVLWCEKDVFFNNLVIIFFQLLKTLLQHLRLSLQQMYISLQRAPKLIHKIVSGTPWLLSYAYTVFSTSLGYKLLKKI